MTQSWIWVTLEVAIAAHADQLTEHGGGDGARDSGLLESAMARPQNLAQYGKPDIAELAASYAFGIVRNHPFVDGNKRSAFVAVELFLTLNGYRLAADDSDCVLTMLAVAAGDIDEPESAAWIREHAQRR